MYIGMNFQASYTVFCACAPLPKMMHISSVRMTKWNRKLYTVLT